MPKMHHFSNKFSKIANRWWLSAPSALYIFDFGDLTLDDVAKFCFFKLIMTKANFKKSVMTSWPLCHRKTSPKKCYKIFPFWSLFFL